MKARRHWLLFSFGQSPRREPQPGPQAGEKDGGYAAGTTLLAAQQPKFGARGSFRFSRISAAAGKIQTGQEKPTRQPLQSEPPQIGPASRLPGSSAAPVSRPVDTTTLDLLSVWQREDATSDPAKLKAAALKLASEVPQENA